VCHECEFDAFGRKEEQCYRADEGRPLEVGLQGQASNHLELRGSKARVVSVEDTARLEARQVWTKKTNASEPLMMGRKVYQRHRNRAGCLARDRAQGKPAYCLGGVRPEGGVSLVRAALWNVGTWRADAKGEGQVGDPREAESTNAAHRGGAARSSDEALEREWSEGAASFGYGRESTSDGRSSWA
jgi:hypothetical protein